MPDRRTVEHTCHATGCDVKVPPRLFMCKQHWFALPQGYRVALLAAYVPGQERRMDPTAEYLDVARRCVHYLELVHAGHPKARRRRIAEGGDEQQTLNLDA